MLAMRRICEKMETESKEEFKSLPSVAKSQPLEEILIEFPS